MSPVDISGKNTVDTGGTVYAKALRHGWLRRYQEKSRQVGRLAQARRECEAANESQKAVDS